MSIAETAKQPAPRRILIIKPSSLGDIVHALPVLAALREKYPGAHIAWLVGNSFAALLDGHPLIDEIIRFDRTRYGRMLRDPRILREFLEFVRDIRRKRFDLVVDLQGLIRSGFLACASGAKHRIGFADAREAAWVFYSQRVRCPASAKHAVDRNLCVARALGLDVDNPKFPLGIRPHETVSARARLTSAAGGPIDSFTAILPAARWPTKQWRTERIAELIDRIHDAGLPRCVLLGAPADRETADEIIADCRSDVIDLVGKTDLRELTVMIELSDRVICHDSGPMHIAAALNKPIVAIFGPTDPKRTGPYAAHARIVATPIECSPCFRRTCWHHSCMIQLEVQTVLKQVTALRPQAEITA